jgi:hypothetical protein
MTNDPSLISVDILCHGRTVWDIVQFLIYNAPKHLGKEIKEDKNS